MARLLRAALGGAVLASGISSCAGLSLNPSSIERWSGPPFPADRVHVVHVLPVADERGLNRDRAVAMATLTREAALSLLREKGYGVVAVGDSLAASSHRDQDDESLDAADVLARGPADAEYVLALVVEAAEPDILVGPSTVRVELRGAVADVKARSLVWSGASVAESGFVAGAVSGSASAAEYGAIYQAMRALLADVPPRTDVAAGAAG